MTAIYVPNMTQTERKKRRREMCRWIRSQDGAPRMKDVVRKWGYTPSSIYRACKEFNTKPPSNAGPNRRAETLRGYASTRILAYFLHGGLNQVDVAASLGITRQRVNEVVRAYRKACEEADAFLDR